MGVFWVATIKGLSSDNCSLKEKWWNVFSPGYNDSLEHTSKSMLFKHELQSEYVNGLLSE